MLRPARLLGGIAVAAIAAGCGSSGTGSTSTSPTASPNPLNGPLTVFAAASLTEAFNDAKSSLQREDPSLSITYSFAGSQQLVSQIQNGAPADVIATADTNLQALERAEAAARLLDVEVE